MLLRADGDVLWGAASCRGRADHQKALEHGNPEHLPERPYGDTPAGVWLGRIEKRRNYEEGDGIGSRWIPLDRPFDRAAAAVIKPKGLRDGLGIHAGRGNASLMATAGCLRMLQISFDPLCDTVLNVSGRNEFVVEIVNVTN